MKTNSFPECGQTGKKPIEVQFSNYLNECRYFRNLRLETLRGYDATFRLFVKLVPEIDTLDQISTPMVMEFFRRLSARDRLVGKTWKKGVRVSTVVTYWSKLHSYFEWLKCKSLIGENPLFKITPPKAYYEGSKELSAEKIRQLFSAIAVHSSNTFLLRRDTAMISLFAFTGIRLGEFISLEICDVDLEKHRIIIKSTTSKSKRSRTIPIHPTLHLHLREYIAERNRRNIDSLRLIVSANADRGLSKHGIKHWIKTLSSKSGVKFHLHQFRHSFACRLARQNVSVVKIQSLLGHSSLTMTASYLRSITPDQLQEDINKISL